MTAAGQAQTVVSSRASTSAIARIAEFASAPTCVTAPTGGWRRTVCGLRATTGTTAVDMAFVSDRIGMSLLHNIIGTVPNMLTNYFRNTRIW